MLYQVDAIDPLTFASVALAGIDRRRAGRGNPRAPRHERRPDDRLASRVNVGLVYPLPVVAARKNNGIARHNEPRPQGADKITVDPRSPRALPNTPKQNRDYKERP